MATESTEEQGKNETNCSKLRGIRPKEIKPKNLSSITLVGSTEQAPIHHTPRRPDKSAWRLERRRAARRVSEVNHPGKINKLDP